MYKLECVFVSTDHLMDRFWFRDDEDFKVAMNYVALISKSLGISVIAFILMSNHVHFVLGCSPEEARTFINELKRRYSKYFQHKYGSRELLRENRVDISVLDAEGESVERAVAYVQMNSVAAGICAHPSYYLWGTGNAFFRGHNPTGELLSSFSRRKQIELLHSNEIPKGTLRLTKEGFVDPASYVSVRFVENLFRSPARYNYFLQNSSKAKLRLRESAKPAFRDQIVLAATSDLCQSLFRKKTPGDLSREQLGELLKQLRFRLSSDPGQLARVLEIPYDDVAVLLDSV